MLLSKDWLKLCLFIFLQSITSSSWWRVSFSSNFNHFQVVRTQCKAAFTNIPHLWLLVLSPHLQVVHTYYSILDWETHQYQQDSKRHNQVNINQTVIFSVTFFIFENKTALLVLIFDQLTNEILSSARNKNSDQHFQANIPSFQTISVISHLSSVTTGGNLN